MRSSTFALETIRVVLRRVGSSALVAALVATLGGCGGVYYTVSANAAQTRLEQARQMGAETQAPFEYYFAREHLRQAQVEAAEASYSDAASYAETAELYAQKAIDQIQAAKREGNTDPQPPGGPSPWSTKPGVHGDTK